MRIACVWVPRFSTAALLRSEPALRDGPVAVLQGGAPASLVLDVSAEAAEAGVRPGAPEAEAVARCPAIALRAACPERDRAAHEALLAVGLGTSPRVEDGGPGTLFIDLEGLATLFGTEAQIAERLWQQARAIGLPAHVAVAGSRAAARAAARLAGAVTVVPDGDDRAVLAEVPLALLDLPPDVAQAFGRWGLRTLGDIAALPRNGLAARLGTRGLAAQDLARGVDAAPFRLYIPPPFYQEIQGLEWEIGTLDGLAAVASGLIERLTARLRARQLATDQLHLLLGLADRRRHERLIELAYPMDELRPILALLCMDLEAHPPGAAVVHVALSARPVDVTAEQASFERPPGPGARELAAVLARLTTLVGTANLGSPVLVDSHRPDAFVVRAFLQSGGESSGLRAFSDSSARLASGSPRTATAPSEASPRTRQVAPAKPALERPSSDAPARPGSTVLALRRLRPPLPVQVEVHAERPVRVAGRGLVGEVVACAGPWRTSGEWWRPEPWAYEEWDVALSDRTVCRLTRDEAARRWVVSGIYD
jgi:protein ImuB